MTRCRPRSFEVMGTPIFDIVMLSENDRQFVERQIESGGELARRVPVQAKRIKIETDFRAFSNLCVARFEWPSHRVRNFSGGLLYGLKKSNSSDSELSDTLELIPYHTTKPNGLGMGLCISRSIVEQHHGTMNMPQLISKGMLTTIRIPLS